jgi:hypothetical protein
VSDIIGQGGERPPRRKWGGLAVAAVLLLVAGLIAVHLPRHRHAPAAPARPAATPVPVTTPVPAVTPLPAAGLAAEPDGVTGQTLPVTASMRLPVSGPRPAWFWPATGRTEPIAGLPPDSAGYEFTGIAGGWAVQGGSAVVRGCAACAGPPQPVYFLSDRARSATRIGLADAVAPGARPGTVWLTSYPPDADTATAAGTAREVSVTGAPIGRQLTLPAGYVIEQATDRGLLLGPAAQRPGPAAYRLWDTAGSRLGRTFSGVIAAGPAAIAWAPVCRTVCQVDVLDLATGRRTTVVLPGASSAANAAFSPDGAFLAVELSFYTGGNEGSLAAQLDVASVASGRLTVVPGTWVSSDALVGFGWPGDGDSLVTELSFTTKVQLASWQPGAARLAVAAVSPGRVSDSLIIG